METKIFCTSLKNLQEEISNLPSPSSPSLTVWKMNHVSPELQTSSPECCRSSRRLTLRGMLCDWAQVLGLHLPSQPQSLQLQQRGVVWAKPLKASWQANFCFRRIQIQRNTKAHFPNEKYLIAVSLGKTKRGYASEKFLSFFLSSSLYSFLPFSLRLSLFSLLLSPSFTFLI